MHGAEFHRFLNDFVSRRAQQHGHPAGQTALQCFPQYRDRDDKDHRGEQHPILHGHASQGELAGQEI
jgi:hypothetical protein